MYNTSRPEDFTPMNYVRATFYWTRIQIHHRSLTDRCLVEFICRKIPLLQLA